MAPFESPDKTSQRYYVPQLDGLRYFAFLLVFIHHSPNPSIFLQDYPLLESFISRLKIFGWVGVDLFLVLSSFLITSLLLLEYKKYGFFSIKDFYIRRSLRIWPLYYFMILVGFFLRPLSGGDFGEPDHLRLMSEHLAPYLVFLGNYSAGFFGMAESRFLAHLWTISLEEQFYILWPVLLYTLIAKKRLLNFTLMGLLAISIYLRFYGVMAPLKPQMIFTNLLTRLDPLVLGALLALYRDSVPPNGRFSHLKQMLGIFLVVSINFFPGTETNSIHIMWQYLAVALGFCFILDSSLGGAVKLQNRILTFPAIVWQGKLCFGLYVYHLWGLSLGKKLAKSLHLPQDSMFTYFSIFGLSLIATVILAFISYQLLEKQFLKMKKRFTHIESRLT